MNGRNIFWTVFFIGLMSLIAVMLRRYGITSSETITNASKEERQELIAVGEEKKKTKSIEPDASRSQSSQNQASSSITSVPSLQGSSESKNNGNAEKAEVFKKAFARRFRGTKGHEWRFTQDSSGEIFRIDGDHLDLKQNGLDDIQALAMEISALSGIPTQTTSFSESLDGVKVTPGGTTSKRLVQEFMGIPVYGGYFKVGLSSTGQDIILINLSLKPTEANDSITQRVDLKSAQEKLEDHLSNKKFKLLKSSGPVYFANAQPHESIWLFYVQVFEPKPDWLEIGIGAKSGEIRIERSTVLH